MNITVQKITSTDIKKLHKIKKRAFKPLYDIYQDTTSPYNHTIDHIALRNNRPDCDYYKILCDGVMCGGTAVYKKSADYYWLDIIFIDPDYQNKKIAQAAISILFDMHPDAKIWGLDFPIDMLPNKKCYERMGFMDTGKREVINNKLTLAVYEKVIK